MTIREKVILEGQETVSDAAERAGGSVEKMDGILKKAALAGGLAIAAQKVGQLATAAVGLAIDAGEAASAFDTTFGPAVDRVGRFVDDFANKAGLAEHELQQMLATTGAVAQGIGFTERESANLSISMATLAGDVASFSNAAGGSEAVMLALQSAINGEREALKTYGLAISEAEVQTAAFAATGKTSADELTRQEKALATIELAYQKAGKQVGDLDRTQASAANTLRRIQALFKEAGVTIGQTLLPNLEAILPAIEQAIPAGVRLGETLLEVFNVGASGGDAGFLADVLDGLAISVNTVQIGVGYLAAGLNEVIDTVNIFGVKEPTAPIIENLIMSRRELNTVNTLLRGIADGSLDAGSATDTLATALALMAVEGTLTEESMRKLIEATGVAGEGTQLAAEKALAYAEANGAAAASIAVLEGEATRSVKSSFDAAEQNRMLALAAGQAGDAAEEAADDLADEADEAKTLAQRLNEARIAHTSLAEAMLESANPVFAAQQAMERLADAQAEYAELAEEGSTTSGELAAAELAVAEAALAAQAGLDNLGQSGVNDAIRAIATALGESEAEARALLEQLGLIDGKTVTAVVDIKTRGAGVPHSLTGGGYQEFATGGVVRGTPGEAVPAVVHAGEQILSMGERQDIATAINNLASAGAGGTNITLQLGPVIVQGGEDAGRAVARQLQDANLEDTLERLSRNLR